LTPQNPAKLALPYPLNELAPGRRQGTRSSATCRSCQTGPCSPARRAGAPITVRPRGASP
jgi:hypothetical protein